MSAEFFNVYSLLQLAGVPLDSHESDLYAKVTPLSREIVQRSGYFHTTFISRIDGELWFDIPFAYYPFWQERANAKEIV